MSISKEIFGIERKDLKNTFEDSLVDTGFNQALDLLDEFELSEEELAKVIRDDREGHPGFPPASWDYRLAKAIKSNQSELFVRKSEKAS